MFLSKLLLLLFRELLLHLLDLQLLRILQRVPHLQRLHELVLTDLLLLLRLVQEHQWDVREVAVQAVVETPRLLGVQCLILRGNLNRDTKLG